jgi:hypothetical protein
MDLIDLDDRNDLEDQKSRMDIEGAIHLHHPDPSDHFDRAQRRDPATLR